jgi:hypothetical protein
MAPGRNGPKGSEHKGACTSTRRDKTSARKDAGIRARRQPTVKHARVARELHGARWLGETPDRGKAQRAGAESSTWPGRDLSDEQGAMEGLGKERGCAQGNITARSHSRG